MGEVNSNDFLSPVNILLTECPALQSWCPHTNKDNANTIKILTNQIYLKLRASRTVIEKSLNVAKSSSEVLFWWETEWSCANYSFGRRWPGNIPVWGWNARFGERPGDSWADISRHPAEIQWIQRYSTGSFRMNVKSKTVCTGINFHKCCFFGGVLGRTSWIITITLGYPYMRNCLQNAFKLWKDAWGQPPNLRLPETHTVCLRM